MTLLALLTGCTAAGPAGAPTTSGSSSAVPTSATPTNQPTEQFTPIVMNVMSQPRWFTGTDGRVHVVYELQLTNGFPLEVTVTKLDVRDADAGTTLQSLSGDALSAAIGPLAGQAKEPAKLAASTTAVAWLDVVLDAGAQPPPRIDHSLTVSVPPGLPVPATITSTGAASDVDRRTPTIIGPPLAGTGWIALPSCCDGPHRRSLQPINNAEWLAQRFAIDFNKINDRGLLAQGDSNTNAAWFTYDQSVLAVADSQVVAALDGLADQIPNAAKPVGIEEADGNYVILQLADGVYAFYAHLKPGSVAVKVGDRVTKGQELGRTGNSGSSTGTHLHFQLMDRPSALVADGLPFEIDSFTVVGQSPPLAKLITLDPSSDPVSVDPVGAGPRTNQLPLSRTVLTFPEK